MGRLRPRSLSPQVRIAVLTNSTADIEEIHRIQDASYFTSVARDGANASTIPAFASLSQNGSWPITSATQQLQFAAKVVNNGANPPAEPAQRDRVRSILDAAGLRNGSFSPLTGVNLTQASAIANASATRDLSDPDHLYTAVRLVCVT